MSYIQIGSHQVLPADPETTCNPRDASGVDVFSERPVVLRAEGVNHRGEEIAYAVGPFACNLCDVHCETAYAVVREEFGADLKRNPTISTAYIDTTVRLGHPKSQLTITENLIITENRTESPAQGYVGWDDRCANTMANNILDLRGEGCVTVGPDGEIDLHKEGFQQEIPYPQDALAEPQYPPLEDSYGQQSLF